MSERKKTALPPLASEGIGSSRAKPTLGTQTAPSGTTSKSRATAQRATSAPSSKPMKSKVGKADVPKAGVPNAGSGDDVVLLTGPTEDGRGIHVLRKKGETVHAGEVRPIEHGKPLRGELVKLTPRSAMPLLCDVETELPAAEPPTAGPARVSTPAYRKGWSAIWGQGKKATSLPN